MNIDLLVQSPVFILAIPLLFAFLTPLANNVSKELRNAVFIIGLLLTALFVSLMAYEVYTMGSWIYVFGAAEPTTGLTDQSFFRITFLADGFSVLATLTIIITAVGAGIYSFGNMKESKGLGKFYTLFLLTLAGVNGMVLTSDLFNLFVWFEVTSIASCGLIAYHNERGESIEAALKYMVISVIAGLLLLFSIGFFYGEYGVLNFFLISDSLTGSFIDILAIGMIMVILAMKASSVPMHMWAPDAYSEAPEPITPFIAITSLGSLFVLFRLIFFVFRGAVEPSSLGSILIVLGVLSMFIGVSMALKQSDLKRLIAYLSVSQIGYMMMAVGVGFATLETAEYGEFGVGAIEGGFFHMINDGIYKALLFLSAGGIIYAADTRDLNKLGGLAHHMPYTTFFFVIGGLSIAGIPPLSGFSSKLMIYESVYLFNPLLAIIALVVSIVTLALIGKIFFNAFLGPDQGIGQKVPRSMILAMTILTIVVAVFSLFPNYVVAEIIVPAVEALGVGA
ncbi:MAG: proton-conducting transporter membrane subunit [Candidatus Saliniplasma sp.]